MTKLELLERLAAIIPRPKVHLTRFSGVFAPHYKTEAGAAEINFAVIRAEKPDGSATVN